MRQSDFCCSSFGVNLNLFTLRTGCLLEMFRGLPNSFSLFTFRCQIESVFLLLLHFCLCLALAHENERLDCMCQCIYLNVYI